MKTQTHLSELDATKLANLRLRQEVLNRDYQALCAELVATYGNPGEELSVGPDNALVRKAPPAPAPKGKRK